MVLSLQDDELKVVLFFLLNSLKNTFPLPSFPPPQELKAWICLLMELVHDLRCVDMMMLEQQE